MQVEKPAESLEEWLSREYQAILEKYKKIALAMFECDVHEVYHCRAALERISKDAYNDLVKRAGEYWGWREVHASARKQHIHEWSLRDALRKSIEELEKQKDALPEASS